MIKKILKGVLIGFGLLVLALPAFAVGTYTPAFGTAREDGAYIFTLVQPTSNIYMYDRNHNFIKSIALDGKPFQAVANDKQNELYVSVYNTTAGKSGIDLVNSTTGTLNGIVSFAGNPKGMVLSRNKANLFVVDAATNWVYDYDVTSATPVLVKTIKFTDATNLNKVAVDSNGKTLYVTDYNATGGSVYIVDLTAATPTPVKMATGLIQPTNLVFVDLWNTITYNGKSVSKLLFVQVNETSAPNNDVYVYDVSSNTSITKVNSISLYNELKTTDFGSVAHGDNNQNKLENMVLSANAKYLYLSHYLPNTNQMGYYAYPVTASTTTWTSDKIKISKENTANYGSQKDQMIVLTDGSALVIANSQGGGLNAFYESPTVPIGTIDQLGPAPEGLQVAAFTHMALAGWYSVDLVQGYQLIYYHKVAPSDPKLITTSDTVTSINSLDANTSYEAIVRGYFKQPYTGVTSYTAYSVAVPFTTLKETGSTTTKVNVKALFYGLYDNTTLTQKPSKVVLEARSDLNTTVATSAATILNAQGSGTAEFTALPNGNYYLVVKQSIDGAVIGANHLPVASAAPIALSNTGVASVDFTNIAAAHVESTSPLLDILMVPGDINADGVVDIQDFVAWQLVNGSELGKTGYSPAADINASGTNDIVDYVYWQTGNGYGPNVAK